MNDFYDHFSQHYEDLFLFRPERVIEIARLLGRPLSGLRILDAGCATGALCRALAVEGCQVVGIDRNSNMISLARSKTRLAGISENSCTFFCDDLLNLPHHFSPQQFAAIVCLGNTLPHLESPRKFLQIAQNLLIPNGILVLQLVHFEKAIKNKTKEFPLLETPNLRFYRSYKMCNSQSVTFQVCLEDKSSGQQQKSSLELKPISREQLAYEINACGFSSLKLFADFQNQPISTDDESTVVVARNSAQ